MSDQAILAIVFISAIVLYIVLGFIMRKVGRGFNSFSRAMGSLEAQNFAARYAGGMFMLLSAIAGVPVIIMSVLTLVQNDNETLAQVFMWIQIAILTIVPFVVLIITELKLRRHFDKNGRPYR